MLAACPASCSALLGGYEEMVPLVTLRKQYKTSKRITKSVIVTYHGPGGPPVVYLKFLVVHREFHKLLIKCS